MQCLLVSLICIRSTYVANINMCVYLPVVLCRKVRVVNSAMPEKEVMYACACVPFTGMPNSFPANTLDVPSKPPLWIYESVYFLRFMINCECADSSLDFIAVCRMHRQLIIHPWHVIAHVRIELRHSLIYRLSHRWRYLFLYVCIAHKTDTCTIMAFNQFQLFYFVLPRDWFT